MYESHIGIVLRHLLPEKNKGWVLDSGVGKIECLFNGAQDRSAISHGALFTYQMRTHNRWYILTECRLLSVVNMSGQGDIFFLHHILELCYYFVPLGVADMIAFNLLASMVQLGERIVAAEQKIVLLFKLLSVFGVYPESWAGYGEKYVWIIESSVDDLLECQIGASDLIHIRRLVYHAIMAHPHAKKFKTVAYLRLSGVV